MTFDYAIIGAGIAGASVAAELAPFASVLLLEAEDQPGYHSTGRSVAFWDETYGGPAIQPLTTASQAHLSQGYLTPLGGLYVGRSDEKPLDCNPREAGVQAEVWDEFKAQFGLQLDHN